MFSRYTKAPRSRPFGPDMPPDIFLFQDSMLDITKALSQVCRWFRGEKEIYRLGPQ